MGSGTSTSSDAIPSTAATQYRSWGGEMFNPREDSPQYKLADIIPVVVTDVISSPKPASQSQDEGRQGFLGKLLKKGRNNKSSGDTTTKTVFLPRSEYLKWFATDHNGTYIGTEPKKQWTEEELDEMFGSYRPKQSETNDAGFIDRMFTAKARGL